MADRAPRVSRFPRAATLGLLLASAAFLAVVLKNAWLCDDAYITYRTSVNLVEGRGLTWNPGERVQAYTNPLWMLSFAGAFAVTREAFYTGILLSVVVSALAVLLVAWRLAGSPVRGVLLLVACTSSRAFTDFSTSGLENPMTHLLLGAFAFVAVHVGGGDRKLLALSLLAALLGWNRLDALLFCMPLLVVHVWDAPARTRALATVALGFLPLLAWTLFATFYYGIPVPNTALVKLHPPFGWWELLQRGAAYAWDSLRHDPATLPVTVLGLVLAFRSRERTLVALAAGASLYLLYVLKIGGDFMSGRFFTAPFFAAVALLARVPLPRLRIPYAPLVAGGVPALLALVAPASHLLSGVDYGAGVEQRHRDLGILDERAFYYRGAGLWPALRDGGVMPSHSFAQQGREDRESAERELADPVGPRSFVRTIGAIGFRGFHAGPRVHYVDQLALADPLLARLPPVELVHAAFPVPGGKIGHYPRHVPLGYLATLSEGTDRIEDPALSAFHDELALVTRGALWDTARLRAIWRLNTGALEPLLEEYLSRPPRDVPLAQIVVGGEEQVPFHVLPLTGIRVVLPEKTRIAELEAQLEPGSSFGFRYLDGERELAAHRIEGQAGAARVVTVPAEARAGFDAIVILPVYGRGRVLIGSLVLPEEFGTSGG